MIINNISFEFKENAQQKSCSRYQNMLKNKI